jgi:hypothetical protein
MISRFRWWHFPLREQLGIPDKRWGTARGSGWTSGRQQPAQLCQEVRPRQPRRGGTWVVYNPDISNNEATYKWGYAMYKTGAISHLLSGMHGYSYERIPNWHQLIDWNRLLWINPLNPNQRHWKIHGHSNPHPISNLPLGIQNLISLNIEIWRLYSMKAVVK